MTSSMALDNIGYHAYGDGIEFLSLDVVNQDGVVTNLLFFEGQQQTTNDDSWGLEFIDLSAFEGQTIEINWTGEIGEAGDIFNCDIALDEISLSGTIVNTQTIESLQEFTISPNPADDKITVSVALETEENATLSLFNTMGQRVFFQKKDKLLNENFEVEVQDLPVGIYHLQLLIDGKMATRKVVIQ